MELRELTALEEDEEPVTEDLVTKEESDYFSGFEEDWGVLPQAGSICEVADE